MSTKVAAPTLASNTSPRAPNVRRTVYAVACVKCDGRRTVFNTYPTRVEAANVVASLRALGCPSEVREVERDACAPGTALPADPRAADPAAADPAAAEPATAKRRGVGES